MNDEIPWAYVAMIFIAFVSWVYGRLKEAAEFRRERAAAKRAAQEARNRARPEPAPSPYRPSGLIPSTPPLPAPISPPEPEPVAEVEIPKTFRELFEMLQESADPTPPPAVSEEVPPEPLHFIPSEPITSEPGAIVYGSGKKNRPGPPLRVERIHRTNSSNLTRILKNRGTLRETLILKEILDTPVALRE